METNKILKSHVLDVIFDNRNKSYGAYELRMNYHKRASKAMLFTLLFACMAVSGPIVATWLPGNSILPPTVQFLDTLTFTHIDVTKIDPVLPKNPIDEVIDVTTHSAVDIPTEIVSTDKLKDVKEEDKETPKEGLEGSVDHEGTTTLPIGSILPSGGGGEGTPTGTELDLPKVEPDPIPKETVYDTPDIDEMPEYLGGEDEMAAFLEKNLVYPKRAIEDGVKGRVVLAFIVNRDGEIDDVEVVKPIGGGCDEEAIRVVKKMPKWKAGKYNGKPVKVYFNLPITFELED